MNSYARPVRSLRSAGPGLFSPGSLGRLWWVAYVLAVVLTTAAAPSSARAADTYLDPLAWTRIDTKAPVVNLVVEQRDTRQTRTVGARRLLDGSRELYVRSADLATALGAARLWQDTLRRLELDVGGRIFAVTGGSRIVAGASGEALLPVPVLDHGGDLWLPMAALLEVIGPVAKLEVAFDAGTGRLTLGPVDAAGEGAAGQMPGHNAAVQQQADSAQAANGDDPVASLLPPAPPGDNATRPLRTVVIDPGHGGGETGAIGRRGTMEKDVNLAVARELKQYLERASDLEVVLTRQRDEAMDLDARAEVANAVDGDLFISLHCNSWFDDQARGFETYFLSPASSDWARSVEAAENGASVEGREPGDVEFIVWELVQNRFITRSSQFAEYLQTRACAELGSPDRGVRQAGFRVLVGAYMPAVLVELGFLSHAVEEQRLDDRGYQRQLARTIGDAVMGYAREAATTSAGTEATR